MTKKKFLENFGRSETLWMYACARCGECVDVCPVYKETDDKYTAPGYKIKKMRGLINKQLLPFTGSADKETVEKLATAGNASDSLIDSSVSGEVVGLVGKAIEAHIGSVDGDADRVGIRLGVGVA